MSYIAWGEEPDTDVDVMAETEREPEYGECEECCSTRLVRTADLMTSDYTTQAVVCDECFGTLYSQGFT